jgi:hypothetical protein
MLSGGPGRKYTGVLNWRTGQIFLGGVSPTMPPPGTPLKDGGRYPGIPQEWGAITSRKEVPYQVPTGATFDPHVHGPGLPPRKAVVSHDALADDVIAQHPEMKKADLVGFTMQTGHGEDFGTTGRRQVAVTGFRFRSRSLTGDLIVNDLPEKNADGSEAFTTGVLSRRFALGIENFFYANYGRSLERIELDRINAEDRRHKEAMGLDMSTWRPTATLDDLSPEFKNHIRRLDNAAAEEQRQHTRARLKKLTGSSSKFVEEDTRFTSATPSLLNEELDAQVNPPPKKETRPHHQRSGSTALDSLAPFSQKPGTKPKPPRG